MEIADQDYKMIWWLSNFVIGVFIISYIKGIAWEKGLGLT